MKVVNFNRPMLLTAMFTCLAVLIPAPFASASYDPLGSGTTTVTLDKRFIAFIARDKIRLTTSGPAKRRGKKVVLPVSGGLVDPTTGKGTIEHDGELVLGNGRKRVPFRDLSLRTEGAPLIAKVGGSQLKVATAGKGGLHSIRAGFGLDFRVNELRLAAKVATRLNKKLRPKMPFEAGQPIGFAISKVQPRTIAILGGEATLTLDPQIVAKLNALFVAVNPIFPAEHTGPVFNFPIVPGGAIAPDASVGELRTGGSIELLQLHGGQVFFRELWLDLDGRSESAEADVEPSPPYPGKTGRVPLIDLDLATAQISSDPENRTVSVAGARLTMQANVAGYFNEAFAERKEVFKAGETLGSLSFTAKAQ